MAAWQIPLSIKPPDIESPLVQQTRALNMKHLAGEVALQPGQLAIQNQVQQENDLNVQAAQRTQNAQKAVSDALSANTSLNPDGTLNTDHGAVIKSLSSAGFGPEAIKYDADRRADLTNALDLQIKQNQVATQKAERLGELAATVKPVEWDNPDSNVVETQKTAATANAKRAFDQAIKEGVLPPQAAQIVEQQLANYTPDVEAQILQYRDRAPTVHRQFNEDLKTAKDIALGNVSLETAKLQQTKVKRDQALQELASVDNDEDQKSWNAKYGGLFPSVPSTFDQKWKDKLIRQAVPIKEQPEFDLKSIEAAAAKSATPESDAAIVDSAIDPTAHADLNSRTKALVVNARKSGMPPAAIAGILKDAADQIGRTETGVATAKATLPTKIELAASQATARSNAAGLTEDDYARAGEQYGRTGVMPALGRDSVTRGKIVKASNAWAKDQGFSPSDIVTIQAGYSGDKKSLENFQKQRDQIVSFENTAKKNLDLFLDAASKIPDTGVPWLNAPLRTLDSKLVGSENMAAVNAARQVANNEIAKVTSGGGLSGVLSDSARNEVGSYNPSDATFAQTKRVAGILKKDMANRHESMDATISDIKDRLGNAGKSTENKTPSSGVIPDTVKSLLGAPNVTPGIHKLSDGTSWMKATDGTITKQ